jgi:hypothetical protein
MSLTTSDKLGPYDILSRLAPAEWAKYGKARDGRLNRFLAIRKSDAQFSERFAREAQAIAPLNHPYIYQLSESVWIIWSRNASKACRSPGSFQLRRCWSMQPKVVAVACVPHSALQKS